MPISREVKHNPLTKVKVELSNSGPLFSKLLLPSLIPELLVFRNSTDPSRMRDARFIAEHRGGVLTKQQHQDLLDWACFCIRHVLVRIGEDSNPSFMRILDVGRAWKDGKASVGEARNAVFAAIAIAQELDDPVKISATRAVGHVVATAHMADHSLRAVDYALKALDKDDRSAERQWQNEQLPASIRTLVLTARK